MYTYKSITLLMDVRNTHTNTQDIDRHSMDTLAHKTSTIS